MLHRSGLSERADRVVELLSQDIINYPRLKAGACSSPARAAASGRVTAARRMFSAAFRSAWAENPHATQRNFAWDCRFAFSPCPQREQVWLVSAGLTSTTGTPASAAL